MRLYSSKISVIAREVIQRLVADGDIETSNQEEAMLDVESVLREYLRLDREVTEQAKDMLEKRGLSHGQFGKVKRMVAERKGLGLGPEVITWICNQVLETFMHSNFIDEVYASDADMRRKMTAIMKHHMMVDDELDAEVRTRIKNLQEGTASWEIEYAKTMQQIKRKRGIDE